MMQRWISYDLSMSSRFTTAQQATASQAQIAGRNRRSLGTAHVFFAFDVAQAIDLERAEALLKSRGDVGQERETIRVTRRAPAALGYQSRPLKIAHRVQPLSIAGFSTDTTCEVLVFDFGAMSVSFKIPLAVMGAEFTSNRLEPLVPLGSELWDHASLLAEARAVVARTVELLNAQPGTDEQAIMTRASIDAAVEDYVVYELHRQILGEPAGDSERADAKSRVLAHARTLARVLRAERGLMSTEEVEEALSCVACYSPDDAVVVDWNAAVVVVPGEPNSRDEAVATRADAAESDAEDVLAVLEYANVELLEMRALDDRLDRSVDQAYASVSMGDTRAPRIGLRDLLGGFAGLGTSTMRHVARMQMDSAALFEGVNNAIKLVGDQYLARVYRLAVRRFHLTERDEAIERKLRTLESLYEKLASDAAARRMEILEWIVIVLIAVSIVLPLVGVK